MLSCANPEGAPCRNFEPIEPLEAEREASREGYARTAALDEL